MPLQEDKADLAAFEERNASDRNQGLFFQRLHSLPPKKKKDKDADPAAEGEELEDPDSAVSFSGRRRVGHLADDDASSSALTPPFRSPL